MTLFAAGAPLAGCTPARHRVLGSPRIPGIGADLRPRLARNPPGDRTRFSRTEALG